MVKYIRAQEEFQNDEEMIEMEIDDLAGVYRLLPLGLRESAPKRKISKGGMSDEAVYESLYCAKPVFGFYWVNDDSPRPGRR